MYQNIYYDRDKHRMHLWDSTHGYRSFPYKRYAYALDENGKYKTIFGDRVSKITKWNRDETDGLFETDINPTTRTLVDLYYDLPDNEYPEHTTFVLDIEVETDIGFPSITEVKNKITAISMYHMEVNKYYVLILDEENKLENKEIDYVESKNKMSFVRYDDEISLLEGFLKIFNDIRPTILTGWNVDFFDIPYIIRRIARILGNNAVNQLSPIGKIYFSEFRSRYFIAGISVLDYLSLYKKFTYVRKPSYRLDEICKLEIGEGKVEYEGTLQSLYETDIEKFIEYSINDVELIVKLDNKRKLLDLVIGISHKGRIPYEDIYYSSRYLEGAILCELKKKKLVAINKPENTKYNKDDKFIGAHVKEPIPGKYDWVFDLDLTSLYPSIIMSLNISPETKVGKIHDWDVKDFINDIDRTFDVYSFEHDKTVSLSTKKLKEFLKDSKYTIAANGVLYVPSSKKLGILPEILDKWFVERMNYKNLMKKHGKNKDKNPRDLEKFEFYDTLQEIQKQLLNSLYGVLGLPVFRFYDLDNAEGTTISGQYIIKYTEEVGNDFYKKITGKDKDYCIYIDTDSVFFSAKPILDSLDENIDYTNFDKISQKVFNIADETQKYINKMYNVLALDHFNINDKHRFNVKQELVCKSGLWIAKKRYALSVILREGIKYEQLVVKGLDTVRSSFPPAFKGFLTNLLENILDGVDKSKIDDFLLNFESKLNDISLIDVARNTSVNGMEKYTAHLESSTYYNGIFSEIKKHTPVHVKASIFFNDFIKYYNLDKSIPKIWSGEKIKYVYLKDNTFGINVLAFRGYDDPPLLMDFINKYVDRYEMYNKELKTKIQSIYNSMKWVYPTEETKTAQKFFDF